MSKPNSFISITWMKHRLPNQCSNPAANWPAMYAWDRPTNISSCPAGTRLRAVKETCGIWVKGCCLSGQEVELGCSLLHACCNCLQHRRGCLQQVCGGLQCTLQPWSATGWALLRLPCAAYAAPLDDRITTACLRLPAPRNPTRQRQGQHCRRGQVHHAPVPLALAQTAWC